LLPSRPPHRPRSSHRPGRSRGGTAGRGQGVVINISSVMGRVAGRRYLAYGTAKAALAHYTRLAAAGP